MWEAGLLKSYFVVLYAASEFLLGVERNLSWEAGTLSSSMTIALRRRRRGVDSAAFIVNIFF
jgi:hypothetical protein